MTKIKIKTKLKTKENNLNREVKGLIKDHKITFIEDHIKVNIYLQNNALKIVRSTNDYQIVLNFKKFLTISGKYDIKDIGILDLKTETKELIIQKNKIYIEYILYINDENLGYNIYEIEYEAIG